MLVTPVSMYFIKYLVFLVIEELGKGVASKIGPFVVIQDLKKIELYSTYHMLIVIYKST